MQRPSPPRPVTHVDCAALFRRFRESGDADALASVFDALAPGLMRLAAHVAPETSSAEDLVQVTFLRAIDRARHWDPERPLEPWLTGILLREAKRARRDAARRVDPDRLPQQSAPDGERSAEAAEFRAGLEEAIDELDEPYATVVRAHLEDEETPRSIAARTGRAPGTVRVQLHRGLERLRALLPRSAAFGAAPVLDAAGPRGLDLVRAEVHAHARRMGPRVAAKAGALSVRSIPLLGAVAVSQSLVVTASLAAVALGAWFIVSPSSDRPALVDVVDAESARRDATVAPLPGPVDRGAARTADDAPTESSTPAASVATSAVSLVVRVEGIVGRMPEDVGVRLHWFDGVSDATTPTRSASAVLEAAGETSFDLRALGLVRAETVDANAWVRAVVRHEQYVTREPIEFRGWTDAETGGRELRGTLGLTAVGPTVAVRLVDRAGRPIPDARLVQTGTRMGDRIIEKTWAAGRDGRATVERRSGVYAVAPGHACTELRFDEAVPSRADGEPTLDLGDVSLDRGATISGVALRGGRPMTGGEVVARAVDDDDAGDIRFMRDRLGVRTCGDRLQVAGARAAIESNGTFALEGLDAGLAYRLVAHPREALGRAVAELDFGLGGDVVTAPSTGVRLDSGLSLLVLTVRTESGPVEGATVTIGMGDEDLTSERINAMVWRPVPASDADGVVVGAVPAGRPLTAEVEAPGCTGTRVELTAEETAGDVERTVVLTRTSDDTTLRVRLVYDGPGTTDGIAATLRTMTPAGRADRGTSIVANGVATFPAVELGIELGLVGIEPGDRRSLDELPFVLTEDCYMEAVRRRTAWGSTVVMTGLIAGYVERRTDDGVREVDLPCTVGGRIHVTVANDPAAGGAPLAIELSKGDEGPIRVQLLAERDGSVVPVDAIGGRGTYALHHALEPGTYTLRVGSREARAIEVKAGEVTRVALP